MALNWLIWVFHAWPLPIVTPRSGYSLSYDYFLSIYLSLSSFSFLRIWHFVICVVVSIVNFILVASEIRLFWVDQQ